MIFNRLLPLLAFTAVLCSTSCKQEEDDTPVPTANLQIAGLGPVEVEAGATAVKTVTLAVSSTNSVQESTTLSVSGLPTGVTATFQPASGTTPFSSEMRINPKNAGSTGTLPVTVTATAASGASQSGSFDLTVLPPCLSTLTGSYNVVQNCAVGSSTTPYASVISADPAAATRVRISNFYNTGATIYADVDCASRSFTIPQQSPPGANYAVDGSGQYTTTSASLYFYITPIGGGGANNACSASYVR